MKFDCILCMLFKEKSVKISDQKPSCSDNPNIRTTEQTASVLTRQTMEMTNAISMSKMIAKTCAIMHAKSCQFSNSLTK